jgi:hypothetical protein
LFGPKKNRTDGAGLAAEAESAEEPTSREAIVSPQREAWRRAAQSVTRAWSEWSAADRRSRAELYRRYLSALDEEEQAAAALQEWLSREPCLPSVPDPCG